jgi:hypothetical protein
VPPEFPDPLIIILADLKVTARHSSRPKPAKASRLHIDHPDRNSRGGESLCLIPEKTPADRQVGIGIE